MQNLTPHQSNALNIRRSISLTANAGSGKTYVLASRFLQILLNTETSIKEIAAITFTEKAAGELYKRVADELNQLSKQNNPKALQNRIDNLRKQLVSANISTIHSFCVDLLKEFPVEASLDANFIPIDQRMANELSELSIEQVIKRKIENNGQRSELMLLIRLLGSKQRLSKELQPIIDKRKYLNHLEENLYYQPIEKIAEEVKVIFHDEIKKILEVEGKNILVVLTSINERVLLNDNKNEIAHHLKKILAEIEGGDPLFDLNILSEIYDLIFTKQGTLKSRDYLKNDLRKNLSFSIKKLERTFSDLKELLQKENFGQLDYELAKYSKSLLNISSDIIREYETKKNQLGYLDFEDILIKTREIIFNKTVQEQLSKKYKYLLVDEYQDTNEIQYEIFLPVVDYLKKGNLFIVGDEKQSIYRFRDAELEVFGKTKEDIRNANDRNLILTLPDSFRMASSICLFTNQLFCNLFDVPQKIYNEVEHSDLVCARKDKLSGNVEFLISQKSDESAEADLIAKRILNLINENKNEINNWNSIAVLVRKRASFNELENAFIKYKIPFSIIGGTGFFQQQSISDIYNYLAFLFNEQDDAALIGVLRSPFFSVSDTKIFELSGIPGNSFWLKIIRASETDQFWVKIFNEMSENLSLSKRIELPSLLRKILNETSFVSTIASRKNGAQEISNLNKLISIALKYCNQEFNSNYDFLSFLKSSIAGFEEEAQAGINFETDTVNLMTIHQAKGLEYDAVFLYGCSDTIASSNIKSKSVKVDKKYGILTKVPLDENYFGNYYSPDIVKLFNFIEEKKSIAELKRLLYVGITRAKSYLFISLSEPSQLNSRLNSFTSLINEGLNPDYGKEYFELEGNLNFLLESDDSYRTETQTIKVQIPIIRDLKLSESIEEQNLNQKVDKDFILNPIDDTSKGEIISATKYIVFKTCPRKYNLTYNYNLNYLVDEYKIWLQRRVTKNSLEYNTDEDRKIIFEESTNKTSGFSSLRGRLVHKILKSDVNSDSVEKVVNQLLKSESYITERDALLTSYDKKEIVDYIKNFTSSNEYSYLNNFNNFRNEFEVYCKQSDVYLFGIIDKVIFTANKLIVVDYKTDSIKSSEIGERAEKYIDQLKFYSFILARLFGKKNQIEMRLIFLSHPDFPYIKNFTKNDETETRSTIEKMIESVRNNLYSVNLEHCSECFFALKNEECILEFQSEKF